MRPSIRTVGGNLVVAAFGLGVGLSVVEGILRVAAVVAARAAAERRSVEAGNGEPIIAFVGDSNIYGAYVGSDQTLAKAVERLSRRSGEPGVRAVNLALPGAASWDVVEQTRRALTMRPEAVVVTAGINNCRSAPPGEGLGALEHSRVVKAVRLALFNWRVWRAADSSMALPWGPDGVRVEGAGVQTGELTVAILQPPRDGDASPFEMTLRIASFPEVAARVRADLLEMAALAREGGSRLVLSTYFAGLEQPYAPFRELMLSLKDEAGVAVADTAVVLPRALQGDDPEPLASWNPKKLRDRRSLFVFPSGHPTGLGYEIEARVVARTLRDIGAFPGGALEDPLAPLGAIGTGEPVAGPARGTR